MLNHDMRAIEIKTKALKLTKRPIPTPAPHQVLIQVAAAGVNRPDIMQRQGLYPAPQGTTDIPVLEISGTIIATGTAVSHLQPGDVICALVTGGGYAEYCLSTASQCLPIPEGLSLIQAAAIPEAFILSGVIYLTEPSYYHTKHYWYMEALVE